MQLPPNARDKIKVADVVVSTNHVTFLTKRFLRLINLPRSAIFVSGTSGIMAISKYRSVNPIYIYIYVLFIPYKLNTEKGFQLIFRLYFRIIEFL